VQESSVPAKSPKKKLGWVWRVLSKLTAVGAESNVQVWVKSAVMAKVRLYPTMTHEPEDELAIYEASAFFQVFCNLLWYRSSEIRVVEIQVL
jgi:hypothetical protein